MATAVASPHHSTVSLVRAIALGQLSHHEAKHRALTEKAVALRAELNHALHMLALEEVEVARYQAIVRHTEID